MSGSATLTPVALKLKVLTVKQSYSVAVCLSLGRMVHDESTLESTVTLDFGIIRRTPSPLAIQTISTSLASI